MLTRHRNPLDAIYDALRLETKHDVRACIHFNVLAHRLRNLPLSREAIQEGIENWVSLGVMDLGMNGWVRWTEDGIVCRVRSRSPRRERVADDAGHRELPSVLAGPAGGG